MVVNKRTLINILFALTVFFYSFDGYTFYVVGLLYLASSMLSITVVRHRPRVTIGILAFLIVFALGNWAVHNFGSLNTQEIRCAFGYVLIVWFILNMIDNVDAYKGVFDILFALGVFEAICVVIEFIMPSAFLTVYGVFFPIRVEFVQSRIADGYIAGFTNQVANTAYYIVIAIGELAFSQKIKYKKNKIVMAFLILALLLTGKRGHLLFCALALVSTYFFSDQNQLKLKTWIKILSGIVIVVIGIAILYNSNTYIGIRVAETIDDLIQGDDTTSSRSIINALSFSIIADNLLVGIGWGRFKYEYQSYFYARSSGTWDQTWNAHNIYLQLLSEVGLIGTVIFAVIAAIGLKQGLQLIKQSKYLEKNYTISIRLMFFIQVFFLLYGITGNPLYDYNEYALYFISIALNGLLYNEMSRKSIFVEESKVGWKRIGNQS